MYSNSKILLLDDDPEALMAMVHCFNRNKANYTLLQTTSPVVAIEIAIKMLPDLIITDWHMPEMDGLQFIKKIKTTQATKDILIMVATGVMTTNVDMKKAMEAGASDFIRKPIDDIELIARSNSLTKTKAAFQKALEQEREVTNKEIIIKEQQAELLKYKLKEKDETLAKKNISFANIIETYNRLITDLQKKLKNNDSALANEIRNVIAKYNSIEIENAWNQFFATFQAHHPGFFKKIEKQFPNLTNTEKRITAFMLMNMTSKEVSAITNQSIETIRKVRISLRKKLNIPKNNTIHSFLIKI